MNENQELRRIEGMRTEDMLEDVIVAGVDFLAEGGYVQAELAAAAAWGLWGKLGEGSDAR